jgi:hypothetical protein
MAVAETEDAAVPTYELACRELHPMGCAARIRGASVETMLHAAVSHGSRGHGFTAAFYDPDRLGAMRAVLSGVVGDLGEAPRRPAQGLG